MTRRPGTIALTVLAYVLTTFLVQGTSHFALNAGYYAGIPIMRDDPIVPFGLGAMVVQGLIFALLFPAFNRGASPVRNGLLFSWAVGAFLASYVVLGEAGKYAIPSISSWVTVELAAAAVQFTLFGLLLGLLHRPSGPSLRNQPA